MVLLSGAGGEHNEAVILAFSAEQVRAAEQPLLAAESGFGGSLMERASFALAVRCARCLRERRGRVAGARVLALVGSGNNGGDALHALAFLARRGVEARALLVSESAHAGGLEALRRAGGRAERLEDLEEAVRLVWSADLVLDALLGIGAAGALRGPAAELVSALEQSDPRGPGDRGALVLAVDLPSGIGVDDGAVPGRVLRADRTVTFGALKPGLLLPPAAALAGEVELVEIGLELDPAAAVLRRLEAPELAAAWPRPSASDHKYSRGVVGVDAGSRTYPGAAVLTVEAAARAGAGMVRYLGPAGAEVLARRPETVTSPGRVQSWVLGPGTADDDADRLRASLGSALEERLPVVVDAGALGVVGAMAERLAPSVVLTPHAGELAALLGARGASVEREQVEAEPLRWARLAHEETGATVLLKGAVTLVVGPGGVLAQSEATPWLATAGAGDVLAGVLGTLLAGRSAELAEDQDLPARLAAVAASVCGRAARAASGGGPFLASQVAAQVPRVLAELLGAGA